MPTVQKADSAGLLDRLTAKANDPEALVREALRMLTTEFGFEKARFYTADHDPQTGDVFILTAATYEVRLGYSIPWSEAAFTQRAEPRAGVVTCEYPDGSRKPKWLTDLDLLGRFSIDIGVLSGGRLIGLLAADSETVLKLTKTHKLLLATVGVIVGSGVAAPAPYPEPSIGHEVDSSITPDEFALTCCAQLLEASHGEYASVFRLSWRQQRLTKIGEMCRGKLVADTESRPEEYRIGEYLTGAAWEEQELRYIPDFVAFRDQRPDLVNEESLRRHVDLMGHDVHAAMYARLGEPNPRYLIRVFNRSDSPSLPFLALRRDFMSISRTMGLALNDLIARRRLRCIASTATAGIRNVTQPDDALEAGQVGLGDEGLHDTIYLCSVPGSTRPAYAYATGIYRSLHRSLLAQELSSGFYDELASLAAGTVVDHDYLSSANEQLESSLRNANQAGGLRARAQYAVFSARTGQVTAVLFARVPITVRRSAASVALPDDAISALRTLVQLFAEAVDSKFSHLTVTGARRAMGYIGHELGTPISILGDAATAAIISTQDMLSVASGFSSRAANPRLRGLYARVQDARGATANALRLAPLVMQAGEGSLPIFVERGSLVSVLEAAQAQIVYKTRNRQLTEMGARGSDQSRTFRIEINPSVARLPNIQFDKYMLRQLFSALLDNAVKYSQPRYQNEPMVVTVSGQLSGSTHLLVSVQNYGVPIQDGLDTAIFEAFVRGEAESPWGLRGMGLGLYLARLIAHAHHGTVDLRRNMSVPRLTTFDVRLPLDLTPGQHEYTWTE